VCVVPKIKSALFSYDNVEVTPAPVVKPRATISMEMPLEVLEFIVAGIGLSDYTNRQIRHEHELATKEGIFGAELAGDPDEQRHWFTVLAKAAREARQGQ